MMMIIVQGLVKTHLLLLHSFIHSFIGHLCLFILHFQFGRVCLLSLLHIRLINQALQTTMLPVLCCSLVNLKKINMCNS
jgi:hypothetical protein